MSEPTKKLLCGDCKDYSVTPEWGEWAAERIAELKEQLAQTQRLYKETHEMKESLVEEVHQLRHERAAAGIRALRLEEAVKTLKLTEKQWAKFYAALKEEK